MCSMPEGENLIEAAIREVAKKTGKTVEEVLSEAKKDAEEAAREGRGALSGDQKADLRLLEEAEKNIQKEQGK